MLNKGERKRIVFTVKQELWEKIQLLIAEEISIARSEGEKTSRLTSLYMKINKLVV